MTHAHINVGHTTVRNTVVLLSDAVIIQAARKKKRLFAATLLGVQVVVAGIGLGMLQVVAKDTPGLGK